MSYYFHVVTKNKSSIQIIPLCILIIESIEVSDFAFCVLWRMRFHKNMKAKWNLPKHNVLFVSLFHLFMKMKDIVSFFSNLGATSEYSLLNGPAAIPS